MSHLTSWYKNDITVIDILQYLLQKSYIILRLFYAHKENPAQL